MSNKKIALSFLILLSLPFSSQAYNVGYPVLFQMQGIDNSGYGWKNGLWLYTDGIGQSNASCPQGSEKCHLYFQMQENSNIEVEITNTFASQTYCKLILSNSNNLFTAKLSPIENSHLTCSLIGDPNAGSLILYINKRGIKK